MTTLVGDSPGIRKVRDLVERIAPTDAPVLITGDSGTGKEVVSRLLHERSKRSRAPFIAVNLAAIPETLMESELFGHERGAFTGADRRRIGRFEAAGEGTILLDEIGALRKDLQSKLLRVLQERTIERLGGSGTIPVLARVLAATNEDLAKAVAEGRFTDALYYRIHVVPIRIPPLRERGEDIPLLVAHFLEDLSRRYARPAPRVAPEAMAILAAYSWPGNVRELENVCERILVLLPIDGEVTPAALPGRLREPAPREAEAPSAAVAPDAIGGLATLESIEKAAIVRTLEAMKGNLTRAAEILGVTRKTLREKAKRHGIYHDPRASAGGEGMETAE